jgi:plastocyanin
MRAVGLVVMVMVVVAGCGGDEPSVRARDGRVAIALDDFSVSPQRVRTRPGETTFEIVNEGRIGHNFHVIGSKGEPVAVTTLLPGDRETATADLRRGTYRMLCTVSNHEELGMYGTLVVTSAARPAPRSDEVVRPPASRNG